ncbi:MAG: tetratricopeptide repeat protein [bacterium]|nr:tetratricopeptide repeat protein [bacterium]
MSTEEVAAKLAAYRERFAKDPDSGVFIALADLLRTEGEFEEALRVLEQGLSARPDSLSATVVMGRTLLESGRGDEARTVLAAALQRDPDNTLALRLMAEVSTAAEDWAAALPPLERLVELEPEEPRWRSSLSEARAQLDQFDPGDQPAPGEGGRAASFATMTLVDIYVAQGYHGRAVAALEQMLEVNPGRDDVRERIAVLLEQAAEAPPPPPAPEPEPAATEAVDERRQERNEQRQQFARWLEQASQPQEPGE